MRLYKTKFIFTFPSASQPYTVAQEGGTAITIEDPKTTTMVLASDGKTYCDYDEGQDQPYKIAFSVIGLNASLEAFFGRFYDGLETDKEFILDIKGTDDTPQRNKKEFRYSSCKFASKPRQTEVAMGLNTTKIEVVSLFEELRT